MRRVVFLLPQPHLILDVTQDEAPLVLAEFLVLRVEPAFFFCTPTTQNDEIPAFFPGALWAELPKNAIRRKFIRM